jgi:ATP sulfurylase
VAEVKGAFAGSQVREMIGGGQEPPPGFPHPEVAQAPAEAMASESPSR